MERKYNAFRLNVDPRPWTVATNGTLICDVLLRPVPLFTFYELNSIRARVLCFRVDRHKCLLEA